MKVFAVITAFSTFFFVACSKDDNANSDPTDQAALKEPTPKEQAESLIKTNYRYLKYYFGQKKPEDYVNESIRKEVKENHAKIQKEYEGLSAEATINKMESEGVMSKEMAKVMLDLKSTADALQNVKTIKEFENKLLSFEDQIYENKSLNDDEKIIAATTSGTLREVMRYFDEIQQGPDDDEKSLKDGSLQVRSGCLWGRKLVCYAGIIVKTGAGAWYGTKNGGGTKGAIIGAAFGFLEGLVNLFKDDCKCGVTNQCFQPTGINIFFDETNPCGTNVRFAVWGTGNYPSASNPLSLRWTIKAYNPDGSLYNNAPIVNNVPMIGTTLFNTVNIPNPNLTIEVIVTLICGGNEVGNSEGFFLNLRDILDDPGSVLVSGSSDALFLETITYYLNGESLINPNNQHQWFIPSQATLVNGGGSATSARVTWNTRTCSSSSSSGGWGGSGSCFRPSLSVRSTSACSGIQRWGWLSVAVR